MPKKEGRRLRQFLGLGVCDGLGEKEGVVFFRGGWSFSYNLKMTCILLRQVISLEKMMVLSVKFIILISWSPICIPLILLSALMRLANISAAVLYNNLDS